MNEYAVLETLGTVEEYTKHLLALPRYHIYQTNRNVRCKFCKSAEHKWQTQYAECKVEDCIVKYKLVSCKFAMKWQILIKNASQSTSHSRL